MRRQELAPCRREEREQQHKDLAPLLHRLAPRFALTGWDDGQCRPRQWLRNVAESGGDLLIRPFLGGLTDDFGN
jgi:hypothetical protein